MAHRNSWFMLIYLFWRWWFSSSQTVSLPEGNHPRWIKSKSLHIWDIAGSIGWRRNNRGQCFDLWNSCEWTIFHNGQHFSMICGKLGGYPESCPIMPSRTWNCLGIGQFLDVNKNWTLKTNQSAASYSFLNMEKCAPFQHFLLNTSHAGCLGGTSAPTRSKKEHDIEFWTQPPTPFPSVKPQKPIFIYVHTCSRLSLGVKYCGCISIYEFVKTSIFDHFRYSSIARNWGLPQISDKPIYYYDEGWKIITMQSWICLTGPPTKILVDSPNGGLIIGKKTFSANDNIGGYLSHHQNWWRIPFVIIYYIIYLMIWNAPQQSR